MSISAVCCKRSQSVTAEKIPEVTMTQANKKMEITLQAYPISFTVNGESVTSMYIFVIGNKICEM